MRPKTRGMLTSVRAQDRALIAVDPLGMYFAFAPLKSQPPRLVRLSDFGAVNTLSRFCRAIGPAGRHFATSTPEGWRIASDDLPASELALGREWEMGYTPTFSPQGNMFAWSGDNWVLLAQLDEVRQRLATLKPGK
ncbi:MAG: hypothetical protein EXS31_06570 [Pedosphaera sp.]|nr:hypothetical protein [Pedosphaera sp.]